MDLPEVDITDRDVIVAAIVSAAPDAIVHAAAVTDVDGCERDPDLAYRVNALGTRHVVEGARRSGSHLCYISTDHVFSGHARRAYTEWDEPGPINCYGRSKLGGERELLPRATIVRTSWLCGRSGRNMVKTVLGLAKERHELRFVDDQHGCPTFTADLAPAIRRLVVARSPGVFHVTNAGATTWFQFARDILTFAGEDPERVRPIRTDELVPVRPARRPSFSVLDNAALRLSGMPTLPNYRHSLERLVGDLSGGSR